ncbi:MAG: recombinase family protein [Lachnospiraceae bacterium]|nr:recombinase family protein [Lachnospiraceae bacterium]
MRVVSYTRSTSCMIYEDIPKDIITQQNNRIQEYAKERGWKIEEKYSDRKQDKEENTAFEQMLQDGMARKFDVVIVDSLFRTGKDLWRAREVLLQTFHFSGIAFVVVEDNFCSIGKSNEEADAFIEKKYGDYRAENIRRRVLARNRNGILSWNDLKYGYRLTEDYQLVKDDETAAVVVRIFQMCADGKSIQEVADTLSSEKVLSPLAKRGTNVKVEDPYKWTRLGVRRLIDKTVYKGYWTKIVQGEEIHLTNEPIISEELFEAAQIAIKPKNYISKKPKAKHPYTGLMCDVNAGFCLRFRENRSGVQYFANAKKGKEIKWLLYEDVDKAVVTALNREKEKAESVFSIISQGCEDLKESEILKVHELYREHATLIMEMERERMEFFRQYKNNEITDEEYDCLSEQCKDFVLQSEERTLELQDKIIRIKKAFSHKNPWMKLFLSWNDKKVLDAKTLNKYITRIHIDNLEIIGFEMKENKWYLELPEQWRN